ncbi:hypothetical protein [Wolbachia pipientis]|uniref:hypothetical protein n=1 Tax=Wolbachia pipientis TaxID=955 RepID=UPI0020B6935C|nr:hypothetical protein [Wolbachia pipientis]
MSGALYYSSVPNQFIAAKNYPAIVVVPSGEVEQVGSRNYRTTFVVSDYSSGKLVGASSKDNTIVIDISNKNNLGNTVVFLDRGNIMYGPSEIKLENIYNIIANVQGNIRIFTDCKTRYVSVNSIGDSHIIQNYRDSCSDVDYEIRKVSRNNIHWRGVKLTHFIVDNNSQNATILNMPRGQRILNKKSIDIITIPQGGKVRVGRSIRNDLYTLAVKLGKNNIIIYIENFDNMQIKKDEVHYMVNIDTMKLEPTSTPSISYPIYLKHYKPSEEGLQIYRNSENNIGVLDLRACLQTE